MEINAEYNNRINSLKQRIENVKNYMRDNPESDPNAREMCELAFDARELAADLRGDYGYEGAGEVIRENNIYSDVSSIINKRCEQFKNKENNPLYKFFQGDENRNPVMVDSFNRMGDSNTREIYARLCGILNYTQQKRRDITDDSEPIYDNGAELRDLQRLIEEHPESLQDNNIRETILDMNSEIKMSYNSTKEQFYNKKHEYYDLKDRKMEQKAAYVSGKIDKDQYELNVDALNSRMNDVTSIYRENKEERTI